MSNPGVILLASTQFGQHDFRVEDNIGEAIHFHLDNIRLDLTVQEYLVLCREIRYIINKLIAVEGFDVANLDPVFVHQIAEMLPDLEEVRMDEVELRDLLVDVRGIAGTVIRPLAQSRVVKALQGNRTENDAYSQTNLIGQSNEDRVQMVNNHLIHEQYGANGQYVVLFNSQNIIRDGQHRAACMYCASGGNKKIKVKRLCFRGEKYNLSMHPWLRETFLWSPRKIFYFCRHLKNWLGKMKSSMMNRVRDRFLAVRFRYKV